MASRMIFEESPMMGLPTVTKPGLTVMEPANRDTLITKLVPLTENMILSEVMNELMARRVINYDERHQIYRNDATDREKVERLVAFLVKKPNRAFYDLLISLRRTGQDHVADILEGEESIK